MSWGLAIIIGFVFGVHAAMAVMIYIVRRNRMRLRLNVGDFVLRLRTADFDEESVRCRGCGTCTAVAKYLESELENDD